MAWSKALMGTQIQAYFLPLNLPWSFGLDNESTVGYRLHSPMYINERRTLLITIENIDNNLLDLCEPLLINYLVNY